MTSNKEIVSIYKLQKINCCRKRDKKKTENKICLNKNNSEIQCSDRPGRKDTRIMKIAEQKNYRKSEILKMHC